MAELKTSTWADIMSAGPELPEHAYRRGYHDGWVMAIDALHDLMFQERHSRQRAYDLAWEHWEGPLLDWLHGDCTCEVWPPRIGEDTAGDGEVPFTGGRDA